MKKLVVLFCLLVPLGLDAQEISRVVPGRTMKLAWIPPPDADVEKYKFYFYAGHDTLSITASPLATQDVLSWTVLDSSIDSTEFMASYVVDLPSGPGFVYITALDTAGNESGPSNKVLFVVVDAVIKTVSPLEVNPGDIVTLTGEGFTNASAVYMGGVKSNLLVVNNDTLLRFAVPWAAKTGYPTVVIGDTAYTADAQVVVLNAAPKPPVGLKMKVI